MDSVEVSLVVARMNSSLVSLLQVVTDMEEGGVFEDISEVTRLRVAGYQAGVPIVGNAH